MKYSRLINELAESYLSLKNQSFSGRYFPFSKIERELKNLLLDFNLKIEGHSVLGNPIYSVEIGTGKNKALMWSQMHGNETTTTKAVFDLLNAFHQRKELLYIKEILENCTIKIIPVLNPDGAEAYTRENHNNIDLNRDAKSLSQPESRVLDKVFHEFCPDFCFNLHDQRTIYSAGKTNNPATLSFLAPSADEKKSVTDSRQIAMRLISGVNTFLQELIPNKIGRYDDEYNPNCVGDKFQTQGTPTLLFEAGHFPGDYQREETRKLVFFSIVKVLTDISRNTYLKTDYREYVKIPDNEKLFYDIIIRNIFKNDSVFDIGVQFREELNGQSISFVPIIEKVGDLSGYFGHREIGEYGKENTLQYPIDLKTDTKLDYLELNGNIILLKLSKY